MKLHHSIRQLADQIAPAPKPSSELAFAVGIVESISAGVVTVRLLGAATQAPYYGALPTVGTTVDVLLIEGSPRILGTPHGVPTTIPTS